MSLKKHVCKFCGKEFFNNRSNSKYCSRECSNKGQSKQRHHVCEFCGKGFYTRRDYSRFCSNECKNSYKKSQYMKECPVCRKIFHADSRRKYCSKECATIASTKKEVYKCDNCGKDILIKKYRMERSELHFCCFECRVEYFSWQEEDLEYLKDNYGKKTYKEIANDLYKSENSISHVARRLGITVSNKWSDEELSILHKYYSYVPLDEFCKMLPSRNIDGIKKKARELNISSYYSSVICFSDEEMKFIEDNYETMTDGEIARILDRQLESINNKRYAMGLHRWHVLENGEYSSELKTLLRARSEKWKYECFNKANKICELTGSNKNLVIHHTLGFNILVKETFEKLNIEQKDINEYSYEEIELIISTFLDIQSSHNAWACITEQVHILFHRLYGYGNNTPKQYEEFKENFKNGLYDSQLAS